MSDSDKTPVRVPTLAELKARVVPRWHTREPSSAAADPPPPSAPPKIVLEADEAKLSEPALAFLRFYTAAENREASLETCWEAIGVASGSQKAKFLEELHRHGLIRLERKGRRGMVHLYDRAYETLGVKRPVGEGVGGTTHRTIVARLARLFARRGYEVRVEGEIGPRRKRVDLVAYGHHQIVGIEVGLSRVAQELSNLRDDLATGVLDQILFATTRPDMLEKVRAGAEEDPTIAPQLSKIRFCIFPEEDPS